MLAFGIRNWCAATDSPHCRAIFVGFALARNPKRAASYRRQLFAVQSMFCDRGATA